MKLKSKRLRASLAPLTALLLCLPAHAEDLVVSAAASLTQAFNAVGEAYEKHHPGQKVIFNFAASGALLSQMRQGAPVDVFASADQATMDRAADARLLAPGSRVDFARNTLVAVVPAGSARHPKSLKDLTDPGYARIAAGTPASVPAGKYTADAVAAAGLDGALQTRWVYGESVRQVLNYVARAEVDAGLVYRTDALLDPDKTRVAFTVPTSTAVTYPIARVAASNRSKAAGEFIEFVRGSEGQAILQRFGFSPP
ncbi:molybdate ABC transporter substrate-binding protein [Variovorax dokdonensis]|uniref:Molybdate ABC transporter substrate-binding protein n=1 Tax=Variovorax dokdonensis TaxID=344883 RepID=A0ABT7NC09_9BURK|nr:molybdate ABC transporter substrate-binding protein [Variovorax dokdonensis]MDM0045480.1 molybdate ABC transporter substrate-binding protein [Variovorax dokdonensis]